MKKILFILFVAAAAMLTAFNGSVEENPLILPYGFSAQIFAEDVGGARHIAITPQGSAYVKLGKLNNGSCL